MLLILEDATLQSILQAKTSDVQPRRGPADCFDKPLSSKCFSSGESSSFFFHYKTDVNLRKVRDAKVMWGQRL